MSTLVKRRAEIIEHGGAEKKHGAAGGGVDSTMLEMERQHKAKILEATKRRMYEEQQRNLAEEAKKEQMIEDERKMDAVLAKRREERDETFQEPPGARSSSCRTSILVEYRRSHLWLTSQSW